MKNEEGDGEQRQEDNKTVKAKKITGGERRRVSEERTRE